MSLSGGLNTARRALRLYRSNGSARAWIQAARHIALRATGRAAPPFFTISPTYRCPLRCAHCGVAAPRGTAAAELSTAGIRSVIDDARRIGALQVTFSGGDPLMRDDLDELLRYAHDRGLLTRINTSGYLLTRERAAQLRAAGLTQGCVSIDDVDPAEHDRLRGRPGAYDRAVRALGFLAEEGIPRQIITYADRRQITGGLEAIIRLGRRLDVMSVYILLPTAIGRWEGDYSRVLTAAEKSRVRSLQNPTFVHMELTDERAACAATNGMVFFVSAFGDITPCPFVPYSFGNVRTVSVARAWRAHARERPAVCRGECAMNDPAARAGLKAHVERVAATIGSPPI